MKTPISAVRRSAEEYQEKVVEKKIFSGNEAAGCKCTGIGDDVLPSVVRPLIRNEKSGHVYVPAFFSQNCQLTIAFISRISFRF